MLELCVGLGVPETPGARPQWVLLGAERLHQTSSQTLQMRGEARLPAAGGQIPPDATSQVPSPVPWGLPCPTRTHQDPSRGREWGQRPRGPPGARTGTGTHPALRVSNGDRAVPRGRDKFPVSPQGQEPRCTAGPGADPRAHRNRERPPAGVPGGSGCPARPSPRPPRPALSHPVPFRPGPCRVGSSPGRCRAVPGRAVQCRGGAGPGRSRRGRTGRDGVGRGGRPGRAGLPEGRHRHSHPGGAGGHKEPGGHRGSHAVPRFPEGHWTPRGTSLGGHDPLERHR